jgi:hypothetical protein
MGSAYTDKTDTKEIKHLFHRTIKRNYIDQTNKIWPVIALCVEQSEVNVLNLIAQ